MANGQNDLRDGRRRDVPAGRLYGMLRQTRPAQRARNNLLLGKIPRLLSEIFFLYFPPVLNQ